MGIIKKPVDTWIIEPLGRFMKNSTTSGIILFFSAFLALILANSPWAEDYHNLWKHYFTIGYDDHIISKNLHHWINDGLMSVFFFVIGLELKREIMAGELRNPKAAILPVVAAIGGMLFPALFFYLINPTGEASSGWGIPMATDIAFALGVLYMLGDRVPVSLKVFLTVLAIADDLGAVLVIAFFYTSEINFTSLMFAGGFLSILIVSNLIGVRNPVYYGIIGIGGVWLSFLVSGVHATIAAVLAAFTIPINVKVTEAYFNNRLSYLLERFKKAKPNDLPTVSEEQYSVLQEIRHTAKLALTPLQRLEHGMHPLVAFVILPIFAFSNAGVSLSDNFMDQLLSPIAIGIFVGLVVGKFIGVTGLSYILLRLKLVTLPEGLRMVHIVAAGLLAAIGFTMSLFISVLAYSSEEHISQAKIGILVASILAGTIAFLILRFSKQAPLENEES